MNDSHRYQPEWPLPKYIFTPGENPHPKKTGGHMEGEKDPVASAIDEFYPEKNPWLRYGIDLFNFGYLWESHVYFEALWNTHGRIGPCADFLKALIKLGAGGLKAKLQDQVSAWDHFERARELIGIVQKEKGNLYLGFDLDHLVKEITIAQDSKIFYFKIHPNWD